MKKLAMPRVAERKLILRFAVAKGTRVVSRAGGVTL